jgi:hypothetical protein
VKAKFSSKSDSVAEGNSENDENSSIFSTEVKISQSVSNCSRWGNDKVWPVGSVLRVHFMDGHFSLRGKVLDAARELSTYGNIHFILSNSAAQSDIRVSFAGENCWSAIGTDHSLIVDKQKCTMNLGWLSHSSSDSFIRSVALHQFGHAIGLSHEFRPPQPNDLTAYNPATSKHHLLISGSTDLEFDEKSNDENLVDDETNLEKGGNGKYVKNKNMPFPGFNTAIAIPHATMEQTAKSTTGKGTFVSMSNLEPGVAVAGESRPPSAARPITLPLVADSKDCSKANAVISSDAPLAFASASIGVTSSQTPFDKYAALPWDEEKVIEHYAKTRKWDRAKVHRLVFEKYGSQPIHRMSAKLLSFLSQDANLSFMFALYANARYPFSSYSLIDTESFMYFPIDSNLLIRCDRALGNVPSQMLSPRDVQFVALLYPYSQVPCSRSILGTNPIWQRVYYCSTCGIDASHGVGICSACVKTCHANHDTWTSGSDLMFCDCCDFTNGKKQVCQSFTPISTRQNAPLISKYAPNADAWKCNVCSLSNHHTAKECALCGKVSPFKNTYVLRSGPSKQIQTENIVVLQSLDFSNCSTGETPCVELRQHEGRFTALVTWSPPASTISYSYIVLVQNQKSGKVWNIPLTDEGGHASSVTESILNAEQHSSSKASMKAENVRSMQGGRLLKSNSLFGAELTGLIHHTCYNFIVVLLDQNTNAVVQISDAAVAQTSPRELVLFIGNTSEKASALTFFPHGMDDQENTNPSDKVNKQLTPYSPFSVGKHGFVQSKLRQHHLRAQNVSDGSDNYCETSSSGLHHWTFYVRGDAETGEEIETVSVKLNSSFRQPNVEMMREVSPGIWTRPVTSAVHSSEYNQTFPDDSSVNNESVAFHDILQNDESNEKRTLATANSMTSTMTDVFSTCTFSYSSIAYEPFDIDVQIKFKDPQRYPTLQCKHKLVFLPKVQSRFVVTPVNID